MMRAWLSVIACAAVILTVGCGDSGAASKGQRMTKTVPDDGQPHILAQRGRFVITQTTLFCGVPARIDRFFEEKGIGVGLNGEPFVMLSFS